MQQHRPDPPDRGEGPVTRPLTRPGKAITLSRDKAQSATLVGIVLPLLAASVGLASFTIVGMSGPPAWFLAALAVSASFALIVHRLRAATPWASTIGGFICLHALLRYQADPYWTHTALPELLALFLLTFAATRFARRRTVASIEDPNERRHGRTASQIVANLGLAGLLLASPDTTLFLLALAALAEATADTVSSELGHALAHPTYLLTTLRRVPPGTDGGISLAGTALGIAAAAAIATLAVLLGAADLAAGILIALAATAGLLLDSLLGATLERRGLIGNDLVNFTSTVLTGLLAYQLLRFLEPPMPYW